MRIFSKKLIFLITILISGFYFLLWIYGFQTPTVFELQKTYNDLKSLFENNTGECNFYADPYDSRISSYIKPPHEPIKCAPKQANLTFIDGQRLRLIDETTKGCNFRYFWHNSGVDDFSVKYGEWKPLNSDGILMEHDFVDVSCRGTFGLEVYRYQHATIVEKNFSIETGKQFKQESEENPSVIMIGFDGMSRSNFIRQMPKSKKKMSEMGFVLMEKHVKVADNTFPNWMAVFMGQHTYDYEFKGTVDARVGISYDNWTEIAWRKFGSKNYVTFFAEDSPEIATFHYNGQQKGFIERPPTDHYLRTFYLAWNDHKLRQRSNLYCYDATPVHKLQFDYLKKFLEVYKTNSKFAFSWMVEISHDYLNTVGLADEDFAEFLKKNEENLENSFVILFSDHGTRYDTIRETLLGRLESRLPVLSVKVPKWFRKKYPNYFEALKFNSQKMTSHFDVFATLKHILNGIQKPSPKVERGISLFCEIPWNRTCFEAEIPDIFCPCFKEISLNVSEGVEYAEFLLKFIQDYFKKHHVQDKCFPMKLDSVKSVLLSIPPSKLAIDERQPNLRSFVFQYRIQFTVQSPSNALLEGVVFKDQQTGKITFLSDLDRNNKYGNSSYCVSDQLLKKLCHCKLFQKSFEKSNL